MIKNGNVVTLAYTLTDEDGEILDQATHADPFVYIHGASQIVPGLENELVGLKAGDKKKVTVTPDQGYGELDADLRMAVSRTQFPEGMEIEIGMQFEASGENGNDVIFTILEDQGEKILIDGNHPLAGETLFFDVEVVSMRDATAEEMSHGHVHGPGGHHH